jgi:hypothetical protein
MNTSTSTPLDSGMLLPFQDPVMLARHNQLGANLLAMEDLYETSQDRFHLIDLSLLTGNDLTAKFLDLRILDGRPLTHENSPRMMRNHRPQKGFVANGNLLPYAQKKDSERDNCDCNGQETN